MKTLFVTLALVLSVSLGMAQQQYIVTPLIATTAVAACTVSVGSTTITHADGFTSVYAGQRVYGVGIPDETYVVTSDSATTITISNAATQGGAKILQFGTLNYTTYGTGDWMGLPFRVYLNTGDGGTQTIESVFLTDNADALGNIELVLFSAYSDTLGQDSAAANVVATEAHKVCGHIALSTAVDLGGTRLLQSNNIQAVVPKSGLWGRLIAKATITPTAVNNLRLRIGVR